jgi:hypothetical protein
MFRRILLGAAVFLGSSGVVAFAAPKDDVSAAVDKLAAADNYSWTTTTANAAPPAGAAPAPGGGGGRGGRGGRGGGGPVSGKADKTGLMSISMAGRGGATTDGLALNGKVVVKSMDGTWQTADEITAAGGGGRGGNPATRIAAIKTPVAQAKDLLSKIGDLTAADDAFSADLPADIVTASFAFGGGGRGGAPATPPTVTDPKGTVKFWVKDGVLAKFELHTTGTVSFNGNDMARDTTATTEIKDVGASAIDVPADAKAKLQ